MRRLFRRWQQLPRHVKAQIITQRILATLMLVVWSALQLPSTSKSAALVQGYFTLLPWFSFLFVLGAFAIVLMALVRPKFWMITILTAPLVLYIGYFAEATLSLRLNASPAAIGILLYLTLLVSVWSYE